MADELSGKKIAILAADGVGQVELERPKQAVEEAEGFDERDGAWTKVGLHP